MHPNYQCGTAHGTVLGTRHLGGFQLTEARFAASARFDWHSHTHAHLCLVLAGAYVEQSQQAERMCEPFQLIFHPAQEPHRNRISPTGARDLCIEILPDGWSRLGSASAILQEPGFFDVGPVIWFARRLYREYQCCDKFSPLSIEGLILELLAAIARERCRDSADRHAPGWLLQVRQTIHDRLAGKLSLKSLAEQAGVHTTHLARVFREYYGYSIAEYIQRQRVHRACRDLAATNHSLAEIAVRSGFYDQAHFTNTFKRHLGMTPSEFRRSGRVS